MTSDSTAGRWAYPAAMLLSLAIVALVLDLRAADLRLPLTYSAEVFFNALFVKDTLDRGWPLHEPALGAPTGLDLRDVPMLDNSLHFLVIKLLGLTTSNWALAMNLFLLLTFPLTAATALHVFRRFGIAVLPALVGSLLYTFLPFHFSRALHHLFLAAYYLVPPAVMVALWIVSGALALVDARDGRWGWRWCRPKLIGAVVLCGLLASTGVYYAFFACFLFLAGGGVAALRRRDARYLALPAALGALTLAVLVANLSPSFLHFGRHGDTPVVRRSPADAELFGLRISQLLLPVTGHRLEPVAQIKDVINVRLVTHESDDASLGLIGSLGFLALLVRLVVPRPEATRDGGSVMLDLSVLNLAALLLATMGGFGALVALTISSNIRAYNRMSIFIAFLSLFAVVLGLDAVARRCARQRRRHDVFVLALTAILIVGLLDQTTARAVPNHEGIAAEYRSDAGFVRAIEAAMPPDAMVFQLPAVPFPEHPPVHRMQDYDHLRGFLHARALRWSYGATKGRESQAWQAWVAAKPPPELLDTLATAGFGGLYLNRTGYVDGGAALTTEMSRLLGQPPLTSANGRLLFFDLTGHGQRLRARSTPDDWEARREAALHPLLMLWEDGCSDLEGTPQNSFRWCADAGQWHLVNGARRPRRVTFEMSFLAFRSAQLRLEGPLLSEHLPIGPAPRPVSKTITIPPGRHTIRFHCDAPRVLASGDRRHLVFRVNNFRMESAEP
jgi:phosphoglycerol transferase